MTDTIMPFARPLYVMAKPVGASCNLRCKYCYYLEKQNLYHFTGKRTMTDELLEDFTRQYIQAQTQLQVLFTWHGGEPMMRPLSFYKKAVELQVKNVQFMGYQDPKQYLIDGAFLLMASNQEGFGMVIIEAQQCGCVPIVVDSYSTVHDIIDDGINGILVENNNIQRYSEVLSHV